MTVTLTIRPRHLAVAVLALALLVPATTAMAFHVFDDVADDRFYSEPIEWAADNGITTGRTPTIFDPDARAAIVVILGVYMIDICLCVVWVWVWVCCVLVARVCR